MRIRKNLQHKYKGDVNAMQHESKYILPAVIKSYGRWASDAFMTYIAHLPDKLLEEIQGKMAQVSANRVTNHHYDIYLKCFD